MLAITNRERPQNVLL